MASIKDRETIKTALKRTLRELLALHGVSGFEQPLVRYVKERFSPLADDVRVDGYGNVIARRRGTHEHPMLMLSAHMDEIGFIVKAIEPNGFLRLDRIGGAGDALLSCRQVDINGHFGLIGSLSGHLGSTERLASVTPLADLYVDVGASAASEIEAMGIRVGNPVSFIGELAEFSGGNRVCGKGMDDRAGVAILIETFAALQDHRPFGCVTAVGTVLEQVGHRGAMMAAFHVKPDYAIAIDGAPAGDTPDLSTTRDVPVVMGQGPVVLLAASTGALNVRGSIAHPAMKRYLLAAAEAGAIRVQLATMINRGSTEAGLLHLSNGGIPTISIGVPRRYSYSPHEMIDLGDAAQAVEVLVGFVQSMQGHVDLGFL